MPLFVAPDSLRNEELPGMSRWSVDDVVREVEELVRLGVQAVILFGIPEEKDEQGDRRLGGRRHRAAARSARFGRASPSSCS